MQWAKFALFTKWHIKVSKTSALHNKLKTEIEKEEEKKKTIPFETKNIFRYVSNLHPLNESTMISQTNNSSTKNNINYNNNQRHTNWNSYQSMKKKKKPEIKIILVIKYDLDHHTRNKLMQNIIYFFNFWNLKHLKQKIIT